MKTIKITPEIAAILERQRTMFIEKFGREPGPNDPLFFDPTKAEPRVAKRHNQRSGERQGDGGAIRV